MTANLTFFNCNLTYEIAFMRHLSFLIIANNNNKLFGKFFTELNRQNFVLHISHTANNYYHALKTDCDGIGPSHMILSADEIASAF